MKDTELKEKLHLAVEDIEQESGVELVVAVVPYSGRYLSPEIWSGLTLGGIALGVFLFAEHVFDLYVIYSGTLVALLFGGMLVGVISPLKRRMISKKLKQRYTRRFAGSVFWENHLYATNERVGLLLFFSQFERTVCVIADEGIQTHIPPQELQRLETTCEKVLHQSPFDEALLKMLDEWKPLFAKYLPPREPNFNELPDSIHVEV